MLFYIKLLWVATAFLPGLVFSKSHKRHSVHATHNHGGSRNSIRKPHHKGNDAQQPTAPQPRFNVYKFLDANIPRVEPQRKPPSPEAWTDEFAAIWLINEGDFVYQPSATQSNSPVIDKASPFSPTESTTGQNYIISRKNTGIATISEKVEGDALSTGANRAILYSYQLPTPEDITAIKSMKATLSPEAMIVAYTRGTTNKADIATARTSLEEDDIQMIHKEYAQQSEI